MRRAGFDVEVFGLGEAQSGPVGCHVFTTPRGSKPRRLLQALSLPFRPKANVLITIDPETSLAAFLATRSKTAWVADVHEDYAALLKDRAWVPRPILKSLQAAVHAISRLIRRADLVLVADEQVPPRKAANRFVMRNEPDFNLLPAPGEPSDEAPWRAIYIGDNRTSRGLRTMIEAVAATCADQRPWSLDLVGPVAASDQEWLDERLAQPDTQRIKLHGRQAPRQAWRLAQGADVGLCLLASTPAFVEAMPSKLYEYQACGLPTVATPLPRVAELLERTGAGVLVGDAQETTAVLRRFAADQPWRSELRGAAQQAAVASRAGRNTYDEAAARILKLARA